MNSKVIHFPFQRHINYANFMRKIKGLSIPEKKIIKEKSADIIVLRKMNI